MHQTALWHAALFFSTYHSRSQPESHPAQTSKRLLEIGGQNVNGSIRDVAPEGIHYIAADFVAGNGVDVVLDDPYSLPYGENSFDYVMASSVFEHSQMFWLLHLEIMRVLKPSGLFYLNAPANGQFHRFPVDCYRFYPDAGGGLVTWANRNGYQSALLESFVGKQKQDEYWNDFVAVFIKDETHHAHYTARMLDKHPSFNNGLRYPDPESFIRLNPISEDQRKLFAMTNMAQNRPLNHYLRD
ncbi:Methyltransferase type 11 [Magnetococcus marinus MC-1]|uniref:Methyltransferase type 11 n=1 Tax=Magnetococcus marinus (strain ATCC BAA-1437 / JCM 17883 / MC-1) TaxID=156889 RepID=A0L4N0_MAGMM|nr:methyltransferase domain-containing protein [Magnetococcus marinus]ABK42923.1 Methyltransferase type 11 [Magnetococcus marinus MC-1]